MNESVRLALSIGLPLILLLIRIAMWTRTARHVRDKREHYRNHPEEFPSRRARILRVLPFGVLTLGGTVWCALAGESEMLPLGIVGVACFSFLVYRIATGREDLHRQ